MSKITILLFTSVALLSVLLYVGCMSGNGCSTTEPDYYYIKVTIMDVDTYLNSGHGGIYETDPNVIASPDEGELYISGKSCAPTADDTYFDFGCYFGLDTPGSFIGTFDIDQYMGIIISEKLPGEGDLTPFHYEYTAGVITITQAGTVGEDFEGVYVFTVESVSAPAPSFPSPLTITGDFRLIRIEDSYFPD